MWLVDVKIYQLKDFTGSTIPPYGILSHTWGTGEVSFADFEESLDAVKRKPGFGKIQGCCRMAESHGLDWVWIDTCCIDKRSSAELSEAINSMFSWYAKADVCFVYLSDVSDTGLSLDNYDLTDEFSQSKWFTRGWTLQELLAPRKNIFFSRTWGLLGSKLSEDYGPILVSKLSSITGIHMMIISGVRKISSSTVCKKMSWASKRETTREEDKAYSLMGLFDVHMPILYGEGLQKAFRRLQLEIISASPDETVFAWRSGETYSGLLASSPTDFALSDTVFQIALPTELFRPYSMTNLGIKLRCEVYEAEKQEDRDLGRVTIPIGAGFFPSSHSKERIEIFLEPVLARARNDFYRRVRCNVFYTTNEPRPPDASRVREIFVLDNSQYLSIGWAGSAEDD